MKKTFFLLVIALLSSLSMTTLYADNHNCSYPASPSHDQYCKRQLDTKYIDLKAGPTVTIRIYVPSDETIRRVTGPYPDPSWIANDRNEVEVTLRTSLILDNEREGWMEIAVDGGYYHVKLIYI